MEKSPVFFLFTLATLAVSGCGETDREPSPDTGGQPVIFTSIVPLAGLVEKIAGEHFVVRSLVGDNRDPHDFSPTPKELIDLGNAAAFFTIGMPFEERLVEKLTGKSRSLRIVDLAEGIDLLELDEHHHHHHDDDGEEKGSEHESEKAETHEDHDHDHDHEEEHDHDHDHEEEHGDEHGAVEMDTHVWLSPPLLKRQVHLIAEALKEIDPAHSEAYRVRTESLEAEIDALHAELTAKLEPLRGRKFYVYHGAFAYFARAYGLEQEAIEVGGRRPEQKRVYELIKAAKADGVKLIFVQPQFDPSGARTIAEAIGGEVVPIDPLDRDVLENLRRIADAIGSIQ